VTCEVFLDRLYDDDARAAGRGRGRVPPDLAAHLLACDACRAAYHAACADDRLLSRALSEAPSPAWRMEVLREMGHDRRGPWSQRIAAVNEAVVWGILAVAAVHVLQGGSSTAVSIAAFSAGGAAALLGPGLAKHWKILRRPLRWV